LRKINSFSLLEEREREADRTHGVNDLRQKLPG
jgi:hypothetical protein